LDSKELASPPGKKTPKDKSNGDTDFLARLQRWRISPALVTAAELVEAAIVAGRETEAVTAARRLVTVDKNAAPLIREQAAALLQRTGNASEVPDDIKLRRHSPSHARHLTKLHPRDPLAWIELALQQTIGGHMDAASRSVSVALTLAPDNRHVLRSAARFFLHASDPERAHDLIARSAATRDDPWLIAAEVAFAEVAERRPRFLKTGLRMLDVADLPPRQLTELAGAIATEELIHGNRRKARKDFGKSMLDPTGSALAQGEWATPELGAEVVPLARFKSAPEASEARAFHLYRMGQYQKVAQMCEAWAASDQFSIRPFEFGSATAGFIEQYDKAVELAMRGLELRPRSPSLLNAAAFALASSNRLIEAADIFHRLHAIDDPRWHFTAEANRGLLAFRSGSPDRALEYYRSAIAGFTKAGLGETSARARVYLAREAILARLPNADDLVKEAREAIKPYKTPDLLLTQARVDFLEKKILREPKIKAEREPELAAGSNYKGDIS
jgi:tetratricopeptide (TPR) repeat protein